MNKQKQKGAENGEDTADRAIVKVLRGRFPKGIPKCEEILDSLSSEHSTTKILELLYDCYDLTSSGIADAEGPDLPDDKSLFANINNLKEDSLANFNRGGSSLRVFNLFLQTGKVPRTILDIFYKNNHATGYLSPEAKYNVTYLLHTLGVNPFVFEPYQKKWLAQLYTRTGQNVSMYDMVDGMFVTLQIQPHGSDLISHLFQCKKEICNCTGSRKAVGKILQEIREWMKLDYGKFSIFGYLRGMPMPAVREFIKTSLILQSEMESSVIDSELN